MRGSDSSAGIGAALVMTCWLLAPFPRATLAQAPAPSDRIDEVVVTALRHSAQACVDFTKDPAHRVAACTEALQQPDLGQPELAGYMEQYGHALPGKATLARDARGKALPANTYRAMLLDLRANALTALGKPAEAIADYSEALQLNRADLDAFCGRSNLILDQHPDRLILIEPSLDEDVRKDWAQGMGYYNEGVKFETHAAVVQAMEAYRSAVRLLPSFARAHVQLGRLLKDKEPDFALAQLSAAIQLDPWVPGAAAFKARAGINLALGRLEPALDDLNQIIARDDTDNIAYLNRGFIKEKQGNLDAALADYSRSIRIAPSATAYYDRANAYVQLWQTQQAIADFNAALAIDPTDVPALSGIADLHYTARQFRESRDDYTRLIARQPKSADLFFRRGNVYFDMGDFAAAYADYSMSLRLDPDQPDVLSNRAVTAERMAAAQNAGQDRRRARALAPSP